MGAVRKLKKETKLTKQIRDNHLQDRVGSINQAPRPGRVDKVWFMDQFKKHHLTQQKIGKHLDTDHSAISRFLSGERKLQIHEATIMASLFSQPLEEVLARAGVRVGKGIPISGWVDGELEVHFAKNGGNHSGSSNLGFAPAPVFADRENLCVLQFQTAGTRYDSQDGGLIYYQSSEGVPGEALGKLCVVTLPNQSKTLLRTVRRGYGGGTYNLSPLFTGEPAEKNVLVRSASPVLWMKL